MTVPTQEAITISNPITTINYKADGVTKIYTIPFDYLSRTHVHITVGGEENTSDYIYTSPSSITFNTAPALDAIITIQRITPYDEPVTVWRDGSVIAADDMNAQALQLLFIVQENNTDIATIQRFLEGSLEDIHTSKEAAEQAAQSAQTAKTAAETAQNTTEAAKDTNPDKLIVHIRLCV